MDAPSSITTDLERVLQSDAAPNPPTAGSPSPDKPWSPVPDMSYSAAESRRAELYGNTPEAQAWRDRYFSGDVSAKAEMDQITKALTTPPPAPANANEAVLAELKQSAIIDPLFDKEFVMAARRPARSMMAPRNFGSSIWRMKAGSKDSVKAMR